MKKRKYIVRALMLKRSWKNRYALRSHLSLTRRDSHPAYNATENRAAARHSRRFHFKKSRRFNGNNTYWTALKDRLRYMTSTSPARRMARFFNNPKNR